MKIDYQNRQINLNNEQNDLLFLTYLFKGYNNLQYDFQNYNITIDGYTFNKRELEILFQYYKDFVTSLEDFIEKNITNFSEHNNSANSKSYYEELNRYNQEQKSPVFKIIKPNN